MDSPSGKTVWMDPGRDIAHAFAPYCARVDDLMEDPTSNLMVWFNEQGGTEDDRREFFKFLAVFIGKALDFKEVPDLATALLQSGYLDLPLRVRLAGGHAFLNVLLGAFFKGAREANAGPLTSLSATALLDKHKKPKGLKGTTRSLLLWAASKL